MKLAIKFIPVLLIFSACAHSVVEERIDRKLEKSSVDTQGELRTETGRLLETAPLTKEQKLKLSILRQTSRVELDNISQQSLKLQAILAQDVFTPEKFDREEVELVKERIRDLENKRLATLFNAVDEANAIMGREPLKKNTRMLDEFFDNKESTRSN